MQPKLKCRFGLLPSGSPSSDRRDTCYSVGHRVQGHVSEGKFIPGNTYQNLKHAYPLNQNLPFSDLSYGARGPRESVYV